MSRRSFIKQNKNPSHSCMIIALLRMQSILTLYTLIRLSCILILCILFCTPVMGENAAAKTSSGESGGEASGSVITAGAFFKSLSDRYAAISDYEAELTVQDGSGTHSAALSCKGSLLRLDFIQPKGQTIVFNGDALVVYLPEYSAVLQQVIDSDTQTSRLGLQLLSRYYFVQYASQPAAEESNTTTLVAYPRGAAEAFRSITLEVDKDSMLIEKVTADSRSGGVIKLAFSNYTLNAGIPNERFAYDPPSSANYYNNFLMGGTSDGN